jgi:hypothetical protein|tara:strand:+ start:360 stop:587 length:228 start_codon:yes stop_codon:yes gene_type:complete
MEFNESINVKYTITNDCDAKPALYLYNVDATDQGGGFDLDTLDEFIKLLREQRDIIESRMNAETTAELFDGEKSD